MTRPIHPDDDTHLATEQEADQEYARYVGQQNSEKAWILSDRDVWYANPAYCGPVVRHPEDYGDEPFDLKRGNIAIV